MVKDRGYPGGRSAHLPQDLVPDGVGAAGRLHPAKGPAPLALRERLLLRAADELHADQDLSDALFAALRGHFGAAEVVEIVFVVGHYTMLSMVANATGVPVEGRLPALPEAP